MYNPCSENKGADQLRGYREADLRLCFRICRLLVFSRGGSFVLNYHNSKDTARSYFLPSLLYKVRLIVVPSVPEIK